MARRRDAMTARRQDSRAPRCLAASLLRRLVTSLSCCLAAAALLTPSPAAAQDERPQFDGIEIGFRNHFKTGTWTPLWVTLSGGKQQFQGVLVVEVPDGDGASTWTYPVPVLLEPAETRRVPVLIKPGQSPLPMRLLLYAGAVDTDGRPTGRVQLRRTVDLADKDYSDFVELEHTDDIFVVLGGASLNATLLQETGIDQTAPRNTRWVANLDSAASLPTRWYGYDGVDVVIVATADLADLAVLEDARMDALAEWVRRGGRLVVSVAADWDQVRQHRLAELLPASLSGEAPATLRESESLMRFSNTKEAILPPGAVEGVPIARLQSVRGHVLVHEGRLPLIVRGSYGMGEVTLVTMDLDRAPFDRWRGRPEFWRRLLELPTTNEDPANQPMSGQLSFVAITDLASQLRHCLERFEGVRLVSFGWVAFFIVLYILLIGPADYFFLKKVWKRLELTWITFPAMVLIVSVTAYLTAYWLKGRDLRVNQIEVIDVDGSSDLIRGTTWFTLFSPRIDTYNLAVHATLGAQRPGQPGTLIGWMGLPEDSLRGMYGTSGVNLFRRSYRIGADAESLHDVPIQVWSTKSFTAQWQHRGAADLIEVVGAGRLTSPAPGELQGTLVHHLDRTLENCVLAFGDKAFLLGDVAPGKPISVAATTQRLRSFLQPQVRLASDRTVGYNPAGTDPDDVLPLMMLYEAGAGLSYSGLTNRYVTTIDWSRHLRTGHAVLYGKLAQSTEAFSQIQRDGHPLVAHSKVHTYVRFLLPVDGSEGQ